MKITNKLVAIASAAVMALSFTGCIGGLGELLATVGKDDFCGTWVADYPITAGNFKGQNAAVVMVFNGKSENLLSEGVFFQSKFRYDGTPTANDNGAMTTGLTEKMRNFYWGTYKLKDNSNYTAGRLVLTYKYGIQWNDGNEKVKLGESEYSLEDLASIVTGKGKDLIGEYKDADEFFAAVIPATHSTNNPTSTNPNVEVDFGTNEGSDTELFADMETFVFALGDAGSTSYCSLNAEEWWMVDQISWSKASGNWAYTNFNDAGYTVQNDGSYTGTMGTRPITWVQPTGSVSKGTAKNHAEASGPWDKKYYSAGRCSWEVSSRTFARITNKLDVAGALEFLAGNKADMKGKYIDFDPNPQSTDEVSYDDYNAEEDIDYNIRSVTETSATYADATLVEKVGASCIEK